MHIEDLLRIPQVRDTLVRHYSEGVRRARENYARHAADDNSVTGARANGKEPYWYLRQLFEALPTARSEADILRLSPFRSAEP